MKENKMISNLLDKVEKENSYEEKRKLCIKALRVSRTNNNKNYIPEIYVYLIEVYFHKDLYAKALYYIVLGQKYYRHSNYFFYFISARATVYIYNNQLYEARKLLLCFYREENLIIYSETYTQLSEISIREKKISKAIYYAKKALDVAEHKYELEEAYVNLIDLYRQEKIFHKAFYFLEELRKLNILEDFHLNFLEFNILVKQKKSKEAESILILIEKELDSFSEFSNTVIAITLELFKQTDNEKRFLATFKKAKKLNQDEIAMLWLIYDHAGDFYQKRANVRKALQYYRLSSIHLEKHRKKSNLNYEDKLDFFRDKYYYLLDYSLFAYNNGVILDSFCFFELSKSSSLRDAIFVESIKYHKIKECM